MLVSDLQYQYVCEFINNIFNILIIFVVFLQESKHTIYGLNQ